eukprot:365420-Chlamydomonas_euryale.AAC.7
MDSTQPTGLDWLHQRPADWWRRHERRARPSRAARAAHPAHHHPLREPEGCRGLLFGGRAAAQRGALPRLCTALLVSCWPTERDVAELSGGSTLCATLLAAEKDPSQRHD